MRKLMKLEKYGLKLVNITEDNKALTDSLKVAEYFGKQHYNVVKRIRSIIKKGTPGRFNFEEAEREWINNLGKRVKSSYYLIDRDGFALLVIGFAGEKDK